MGDHTVKAILPRQFPKSQTARLYESRSRSFLERRKVAKNRSRWTLGPSPLPRHQTHEHRRPAVIKAKVVQRLVVTIAKARIRRGWNRPALVVTRGPQTVDHRPRIQSLSNHTVGFHF